MNDRLFHLFLPYILNKPVVSAGIPVSPGRKMTSGFHLRKKFGVAAVVGQLQSKFIRKNHFHQDKYKIFAPFVSA